MNTSKKRRDKQRNKIKTQREEERVAQKCYKQKEESEGNNSEKFF